MLVKVINEDLSTYGQIVNVEPMFLLDTDGNLAYESEENYIYKEDGFSIDVYLDKELEMV